MKKLTKTTALILSLLMLFGCASNYENSDTGNETTQPSESSATESKTENSETDSDTSNSETSEDTRNYNLVENKEGYHTFSFDPEKHTILNRIEFTASITGRYELGDVGYEGVWPYDPTPENLKKNFREKFDPIAVKCHVAGDSYYFVRGKCGEVEVFEPRAIPEYSLYTPVVIEEIIDSYDYDCSFKEGDIIYVRDIYNIADPDNSNFSGSKQYVESLLEDTLYHASLHTSESNYVAAYAKKENLYTKLIEFYDLLLSDGPYILSSWSPVFLQKGQSYLMFLNNKDNTPNEVDGNIYNCNYGIPFDLENDEPFVYKSEAEDELIFHYGKCYPYQWKYLKEKYGEHFKK